jgi:hypothetical protein
MGKNYNSSRLVNGLSVDASGNVGVNGTPSGSYKFEVTGTGRFTGSVFGDVGFRTKSLNGYLLKNDADSSNLGGLVRRSYWAGGAALDTQIFAETGYGIFLNVNGSSSTGMVINSTGNVGIGTSTPALTNSTRTTLDVGNASQSLIVLSTGGTWRSYFYNDGTNLSIANSGGFINFDVLGERMRITSAGNVGIGTSSPSYLLDVINGSNPSLRVRNAALGGSATLLLETANDFTGTCQAYVRVIGSTGNGNSTLTFGTAGATGDTTATERIRIMPNGDFLVGTTTSPYVGTNRGNIFLNGVSQSLYGFGIGGAARGYMYHAGTQLYFENSASGGNLYMTAGSAGVVLNNGATSWTSNSDERLKDITGDIENAVDSLMTLRTIKHTWKSDATKKECLALIAQDVEKVFPQVIDKYTLPVKPDEENPDETEYLGVRYTDLIPVLVAAIQEQQKQIEELKQLVK